MNIADEKYIRGGVIWAAGLIVSLISKDTVPMWVGWGVAMVLINTPDRMNVAMMMLKLTEEDLKAVGFTSFEDLRARADAARRGDIGRGV